MFSSLTVRIVFAPGAAHRPGTVYPEEKTLGRVELPAARVALQVRVTARVPCRRGGGEAGRGGGGVGVVGDDERVLTLSRGAAGDRARADQRCHEHREHTQRPAASRAP